MTSKSGKGDSNVFLLWKRIERGDGESGGASEDEGVASGRR